jgi:hypothetical protein
LSVPIFTVWGIGQKSGPYEHITADTSTTNKT